MVNYTKWLSPMLNLPKTSDVICLNIFAIGLWVLNNDYTFLLLKKWNSRSRDIIYWIKLIDQNHWDRFVAQLAVTSGCSRWSDSIGNIINSFNSWGAISSGNTAESGGSSPGRGLTSSCWRSRTRASCCWSTSTPPSTFSGSSGPRGEYIASQTSKRSFGIYLKSLCSWWWR